MAAKLKLSAKSTHLSMRFVPDQRHGSWLAPLGDCREVRQMKPVLHDEPKEIATGLIDDDEALTILRAGLSDVPRRPVYFPAPATPEQADADLSGSARNLVSSLNLMETADGDVTLWKTPFSKQAITGGVTFITKLAGGSVSLVALGTAIYTFYQGFPEQGTPRLVLWACATVLLAVATLAIAIIVRADVAGRAAASAAEYNARAAVAAAYLRASEDLLRQPDIRQDVQELKDLQAKIAAQLGIAP